MSSGKKWAIVSNGIGAKSFEFDRPRLWVGESDMYGDVFLDYFTARKHVLSIACSGDGRINVHLWMMHHIIKGNPQARMLVVDPRGIYFSFIGTQDRL